MEKPPDSLRGLPRALHGLWQFVWALLWLLLCFAMLVFGLCGLNFVATGLLSFFVDLGNFGPRLGGELVQTIAQRTAFVVVGTFLGGASVIFFLLASRERFGRAVVLFVAMVVFLLLAGWATGIDSIAGGFGNVGYVEAHW